MSDSGYSFVELLLVLMVAVVLLAGGIMLYERSAIENLSIEHDKIILRLKIETEKLFAGRSYDIDGDPDDDVLNSVLVANEAIDKRYIRPGTTTIFHPSGTSFVVTSLDGGEYFSITVEGVENDLCAFLMMQYKDDPDFVEVSAEPETGTAMITSNPTLGNVIDHCNGDDPYAISITFE